MLRGLSILLTLAVVDYLVLPQLAGTRRALGLLESIRPWWAALAVALEVASVLGYSMMTRSVLPAGRPRYGWLLRSDLSALGLSHVLPGGTATAAGLRYRLLREGGAAAEDVTVGIAWQGVASTVVLLVLLWVALMASIPLAGLHPLYVAAAVLGAVIITAAFVAIAGRRHDDGPPKPAPWITAYLPARYRSRAVHALTEALSRLHELLTDHRGLRVSAGWSTSSWVLDASSLAVLLLAFGHGIDPARLFVAYGLANVVAILPITPGGLGVIEGILIPSLVGFGVPPAVGVLAVVSWRLLDFWAPIPVAGVCYASLRLERWRHAASGLAVPDRG